MCTDLNVQAAARQGENAAARALHDSSKTHGKKPETPCPIGRDYADVIADARSKRAAAADDLGIIAWGQVALEIQRIVRRHVQGCAVCLEHGRAEFEAAGRRAAIESERELAQAYERAAPTLRQRVQAAAEVR
jgi:hypothetical protein